MKYYPLAAPADDPAVLAPEYQQARQIGKLRLGERRLYFRSGRKIYYISYTDIRRYFRRVLLVPAKLCCGRGNLEVEHLVICGDAGELAQIQLPGTKAAKVVMECMEKLAPDAETGRPKEEKEE